nr:hypothetical protein [Cressdnaviricota sp.]
MSDAIVPYYTPEQVAQVPILQRFGRRIIERQNYDDRARDIMTRDMFGAHVTEAERRFLRFYEPWNIQRAMRHMRIRHPQWFHEQQTLDPLWRARIRNARQVASANMWLDLPAENYRAVRERAHNRRAYRQFLFGYGHLRNVRTRRRFT